jgi:hypothetical protein
VLAQFWRSSLVTPLAIYATFVPSVGCAFADLPELPGRILSLCTILCSLSEVCLYDSTGAARAHLLGIYCTFASSVGCACVILPELPRHILSPLSELLDISDRATFGGAFGVALVEIKKRHLPGCQDRGGSGLVASLGSKMLRPNAGWYVPQEAGQPISYLEELHPSRL